MEEAAKKMSRRKFVAVATGASVGLGLEGFPSSLQSETRTSMSHLRCEVLVCGATPSGIAAAVTAARLGCEVMLVEYEDHIGGIISNGLTNTDLGEEHRSAVGGFFNQFTNHILEHYRRVDANDPDMPNVKVCRGGFAYEPKIAEALFNQFVTEQARRLRLLLRHELKRAIVIRQQVAGAIFEMRDEPGRHVQIDALVLIDATYEGDLAAMSTAEFRLGREGRTELNEPHAGKIYMEFGSSELLTGSTGEADKAIEAYCFRFSATKDPRHRVPMVKPAGYDKSVYFYLLEDIRSGKVKTLDQVFGVYSMPGNKVEFNSHEVSPRTGVPSESLDLAEECWSWPEAKPEQRRKIYERYLAHNVGMLWMLQNDPEIPPDLREDARQYGWCKDEFVHNNHLPRQVYVRAGRRIVGEYLITELDGDIVPAWERTRLQPTSIALVEWGFDCHGCHRYDPAHPGTREGYILVNHPVFQIPYGAVVPKVIDGLLVPVACSATHVAYNAVRMEPVFMALGEACGHAAHLAVKQNVPIRAVSVEHLQHGLLANGGVITYFDDLPQGDDAFEACQWLGARGLNKGYLAETQKTLTYGEGAERLERVLNTMNRSLAGASGKKVSTPLSMEDVIGWLHSSGFFVGSAVYAWLRHLPLTNGITVSQFAQIVYKVIGPPSSDVGNNPV